MILLDTHIWIWLINDKSKLTDTQIKCIDKNIDELTVSIMSCWEVAKKVSLGKLILGCSIQEWFQKAIEEQEITVTPITLDIVMESNNLPGSFHRDPMDELIVATSRINDWLLVTSDEKILNYQHVKTVH